MPTAAAWLILGLYLGHAVPPWLAALRRARQRVGDGTALLYLLPYLVAVRFAPAIGDLARFGLYIALPVLLLRFLRRDRPHLGYLLAALALWLPLEPDLFLLPWRSAAISPLLQAVALPDLSVPLVPGLAIPLEKLTGVALALYLFTVQAPLPSVGFTYRLGREELRSAMIGLGAFALVGIPVGLAWGFLQPGLNWPGVGPTVLGLLGGYLLVALPEEVLFRGVIQNVLAHRLSAGPALPLAAVIFGLAHLNNATAGFPVPNGAYAVMATLAGLAYGWVWQRTRKVTASAITHALVNAVWALAFGG